MTARTSAPRHIPALATALLVVSLTSCIQPPPPRTYSSQAARHLRQLSHDIPTTPVPGYYSYYGYYGYGPGWNY